MPKWEVRVNQGSKSSATQINVLVLEVLANSENEARQAALDMIQLNASGIQTTNVDNYMNKPGYSRFGPLNTRLKIVSVKRI